MTGGPGNWVELSGPCIFSFWLLAASGLPVVCAPLCGTPSLQSHFKAPNTPAGDYVCSAILCKVP